MNTITNSTNSGNGSGSSNCRGIRFSKRLKAQQDAAENVTCRSLVVVNSSTCNNNTTSTGSSSGTRFSQRLKDQQNAAENVMPENVAALTSTNPTTAKGKRKNFQIKLEQILPTYQPPDRRKDNLHEKTMERTKQRRAAAIQIQGSTTVRLFFLLFSCYCGGSLL